jgi:choice-of-anchor A domain-containing protein
MREWVRPLAVVLGAGLVLAASAATASPLTAEQILRQFNLVVLGDLNAGGDVEGRTFVGGDLKGNSATFYTRPAQVAPSDFAALLVGGDVTGNWKNVNGSGDAVIAGNVAQMNMNGGKAFIGGSISNAVNGQKQTGASVAVQDAFGDTLRALSLDLAALDPNSAIGFSNVSPNQKATFDAAADADGLAVFDIADGAAFFASIGEIAFNLNGAGTIVINVGGLDLDVAENFLGGIGAQLAGVAIWNFYEAVSLDFEREFFGSVLAPYAQVRNMNALNGSIVAQSLTQRGAVRLPGFAGSLPDFAAPEAIPAPEPAMGLVLLSGGLLLIALRRRSLA